MSHGTGVGRILACGLFVVLQCAAPAEADGFEDKDLSLRLPAALSRFSTYADVTAMGGTSGASKWPSSMNPASSAWLDIVSRLGLSVSPQYSQICLENGSRLHVTSQSLVWDAKTWGTFQPSMAQVRGNKETTRQGLDFGFEMDYFSIQWAKRLAEKWALGANFNFARSKNTFDLGPFDVAKSEGETYDFRLGTLYQAMDKLLLGLVFDYGFSPGRTTLIDPTGMGLGNVTTHDTTHQFLLRPGISFEYQEDSGVYFDYQFGAFCNDTGTLTVNRFYAGVDHKICRWLFVRGGGAIDCEGNPAWGVGFGLYPTDWLTIDVGYQEGMLPELEPDFGRSRVVTVSLAVKF